MQPRFSRSTVEKANMQMILGIKSEHHVSVNLSYEDIERAGREAFRRVCGGGKLSHNLDRLWDISELGEDWNGYGAVPIPREVIKEVKEIILNLEEQPEIFPTADKSIQLEYWQPDKSYLEIEVSEKNITAMQIPQENYEDAKFWDLSFDDIGQIQQIVSDFFNTK